LIYTAMALSGDLFDKALMQRVGTHRGAEKEALHLRATSFAQESALKFRFDAFGNHVFVEAARHRNDGAGNGGRFRILRDIADKCAIDL
jgi:hypothetical protein